MLKGSQAGRTFWKAQDRSSAAPWLFAIAFAIVLIVAACWDQRGAAWAAHLPVWVRNIGLVVTAFGNSNYMFLVSGCVIAASWWIGTRTPHRGVLVRMHRLTNDATFFLIAIATSGLAVQLLKHVIGRVRPRFALESSAFSFHVFSLSPSFASFPSGHTVSAFAAATALGSMWRRGRPFLFVTAAVIGASRVVVGDHYLSDVVSGAALGVLVPLLLTQPVVASARRQALQSLPVAISAFRSLEKPSATAKRSWRLATGYLLLKHRHWYLPAFAGGIFAFLIPPTDLFGSEGLEHTKDGLAILIAFTGLTLRALVIGLEPASAPRAPSAGPPPFPTQGMYSLSRNPLDLGNVLIFTGVFLMHGNAWTILLGTAIYAGATSMMVMAEEDDLFLRFGPAYARYRHCVPRWVPNLSRLGQVTRQTSFDVRRAFNAEYPVFGLTIVALALAEFYENIQEPLQRLNVVYLTALSIIIVGVALGTGAVWLLKRSRISIDSF